jgi:hypothetical protein
VGLGYTFSVPQDPGYTSAVARYIRDAVYDRIRYDVIPDPTLTDRVLEINHREHVINVRPGMDLRRFHCAIDRAVLFVVGGIAWAPEFIVRPQLSLVRELPDAGRN